MFTDSIASTKVVLLRSHAIGRERFYSACPKDAVRVHCVWGRFPRMQNHKFGRVFLYKEIRSLFLNHFQILIRMPKSFLVKHKNICAFYDREAMETKPSAFHLVMPSPVNREYFLKYT